MSALKVISYPFKTIMKTFVLGSIILWTVQSFAGSIQYSYDAAGRLAKADYGSGKTIAYTYDNSGNLLRRLAEARIIASADLAILAQMPAASFELGRANLIYTLTVTNAGPAAASQVRVTNTLPVDVLFVSASKGEAANGVFTASLGNLNAGTVTDLRLELLPLTHGVFVNTATVSADTPDANPQNNAVTCTNLVLVAADSDANGLPDWWEQYYFPNPADRISTKDFDGDGVSNRDEYLAGTDPTNQASVLFLAINPSQESPSAFSISFGTAPGRLYQVEVAPQLWPALWLPLAEDLPGSGQSNTITEPNLGAARFYRLKVTLPLTGVSLKSNVLQ
jgi:uncharacterized repeat protein (TIGR01451 family)